MKEDGEKELQNEYNGKLYRNWIFGLLEKIKFESNIQRQ